jgi:hypothetical protein
VIARVVRFTVEATHTHASPVSALHHTTNNVLDKTARLKPPVASGIEVAISTCSVQTVIVSLAKLTTTQYILLSADFL